MYRVDHHPTVSAEPPCGGMRFLKTGSPDALINTALVERACDEMFRVVQDPLLAGVEVHATMNNRGASVTGTEEIMRCFLPRIR